MLLRVLATVVVLLASACAAGSDDAEGADPCRLLSIEDASRIVGVGYTGSDDLGDACFYGRPGTDQAFTLRLIAYQDDYDQVLSDARELGYKPGPVEIPGADRAVALVGPHRGVLAEREGDAFEVTLDGDVATASRLMAVVLGGDPGPGPKAVVSPCDALSLGELARLLGQEPRARAGAEDVALKSCTWRAAGREVVVATGRGRGPASEFWRENLFVAEGVSPDEVRLPRADEALLVTGRGSREAGLAVSAGDLSYVVNVRGRTRDARTVALRIATALL